VAWTLKGSDTFTDTALTGIASHTPTPSGGFSWSVIGVFTGTPRIDVDGIKFNVGGAADGAALASLVLADVQKAEVTLSADGIRVGILGDSSGNGYVFMIRDGLSSVIQRYDAGSATNLVTGGPSAAIGDVGSLETDGAGNFTARINGTIALTTSSPDTTYTSGKAWLLAGPGAKGDDFAAYEDAGGAAGHPAMRRLGLVRGCRPCEVGRYGVKVF
jgi:hypothetical protein